MKSYKCESVDLMLVGCAKKKADGPNKAKDLYASPLWRHRRQYAENHQVPWFILSAKHGLLSPDAWIEPYDLALSSLSTKERREWSKSVLTDLVETAPNLLGKNIEIHAGKDYADFGLTQGLSELDAFVSRPLAHIGMWYQPAWYQEHMNSCPKQTTV